MNSIAFKKGVERALLPVGFERSGKLLRRHGLKVWTLVNTEQGLGNQWHINVGFWLGALSPICAMRVEQAHLYFRLERLFPEHYETIVLAGALGDQKQPTEFIKLIELLAGDIGARLLDLGTEEGLRAVMTTGGLECGLVRKEARLHLTGGA